MTIKGEHLTKDPPQTNGQQEPNKFKSETAIVKVCLNLGKSCKSWNCLEKATACTISLNYGKVWWITLLEFFHFLMDLQT